MFYFVFSLLYHMLSHSCPFFKNYKAPFYETYSRDVPYLLTQDHCQLDWSSDDDEIKIETKG